MAKVRSPNYPAIDLGAALEAVRPAWKAEHRNKMPKAVLARHLGYGSLNGRALGKIGAVRAYGLVEGAGNELRISDDAVIALTSPDKAGFVYKDAMLRLALKPQLFLDLRNENPDRLPSEDNLQFQLVQKGFTEDAAGKAAKNFLATMRLVFDGAEAHNPTFAKPEAEASMAQAHEAGHTNLGRPKDLTVAPPGIGKTALLAGATRQEVITLDEGDVTITFPADLSSQSFDDLKDHMDLFVKKMQRRANLRARYDDPEYQKMREETAKRIIARTDEDDEAAN
jgi:hypothetical protein